MDSAVVRLKDNKAVSADDFNAAQPKANLACTLLASVTGAASDSLQQSEVREDRTDAWQSLRPLLTGGLTV